MRRPLSRHPDFQSAAVTQVEVDVVRPRKDRLVLSYAVTGTISDVHLPPVVAASRGDELWRHTCFEAFIGGSAGDAYYELNFSPSTQWAAYRFVAYRAGMCVAVEAKPPLIEADLTPGCYTLRASLDLDGLLALPPDASAWRLGLSAVIEEGSGRKSYWALAHPPGKPDFHHAVGLAYEFIPAV